MTLARKLDSIVFVTGAAILALEIAAGRAMQPAFGTSLFIWGAVLSVTLLCLALGYRWGGSMADKLEDPWRRLTIFIASSGLWLVVLPLITPALLLLGTGAGPAAGPIVVAILLFAIPLTLLATSVPLAFGILMKSSDELGKSMGRLFAVSTAGSIAGALVTAYVLVPQLGLRASLIATAALLLGVAALLAVRGHAPGVTTALLAAAIAASVLPGQVSPAFAAGIEVLHRTDTQYGHVVVLDDRRTLERILLLDGTAQTVANGPTLARNGFAYARLMTAAARAHESRGRALLLGLGGGTLARSLSGLGYQVDAVELDPELVSIARRFFALGSETNVHVADARAFVERARAQKRHYELIVIDVAGAGHHPAHVYSLESFEAMAPLLGPSGLLAVNMIVRTNPVDDFGRAVVSSLRKTFPEVRSVLPAQALNDDQLGNLVVLASSRDVLSLQLPDDYPDAFVEGYEPATDDHNPGELSAQGTNDEVHKNSRAWLGDGCIMPW